MKEELHKLEIINYPYGNYLKEVVMKSSAEFIFVLWIILGLAVFGLASLVYLAFVGRLSKLYATGKTTGKRKVEILNAGRRADES